MSGMLCVFVSHSLKHFAYLCRLFMGFRKGENNEIAFLLLNENAPICFKHFTNRFNVKCVLVRAPKYREFIIVHTRTP